MMPRKSQNLIQKVSKPMNHLTNRYQRWLESYLESFKVVENAPLTFTILRQNLIQKVSKSSILTKIKDYINVRILFRKFQSENHHCKTRWHILRQNLIQKVSKCWINIHHVRTGTSQNLIQKVSKWYVTCSMQFPVVSQNLIQKVSKGFFSEQGFEYYFGQNLIQKVSKRIPASFVCFPD